MYLVFRHVRRICPLIALYLNRIHITFGYYLITIEISILFIGDKFSFTIKLFMNNANESQKKDNFISRRSVQCFVMVFRKHYSLWKLFSPFCAVVFANTRNAEVVHTLRAGLLFGKGRIDLLFVHFTHCF